MEIWIHFVNLNLFPHTAVAYWLLRKWSVPAEAPHHQQQFLRFIFSENIAVHCILRGEYLIFAYTHLTTPPSPPHICSKAETSFCSRKFIHVAIQNLANIIHKAQNNSWTTATVICSTTLGKFVMITSRIVLAVTRITVVLSIGYGGLAPMHIWLTEVANLCCVLIEPWEKHCLDLPSYISIPSMLQLHVATPRPAMPCMEAVYLLSGCTAYNTSTWLTHAVAIRKHAF